MRRRVRRRWVRFTVPSIRRFISTSRFRRARTRFGAPGDFAQAYVIAHELGHHVQHLLETDVESPSRAAANPGSGQRAIGGARASGRLLRGRLGEPHEGRELLEPGDIDEGLNAAAAVGDDRIQKQKTGVERRIVHARFVAARATGSGAGLRRAIRSRATRSGAGSSLSEIPRVILRSESDEGSLSRQGC